ncbi:MAG TPA: hypothetical protein VLB73_02450 [Patescibacteria group bacterium]|nr:hypothetical protein [Patescibacteria group bacterium]
MKTNTERQGLFDHGKRYRLHSKGFGSTNTTTPFTEYVTRTEELNHPKRVEHNFFRSQPVLLHYQLTDGSEVVMHRPGNPYGPVDSLVVAKDESVKHMSPETLTQKSIYDMSPLAQRKYWQVAMAELVALDQIKPPKRRHGPLHAVLMENNTPISLLDSKYKDESGYSPRTSRTIFIPHAHVTLMDTSWLQEADWHIPELDKEQSFIRYIQNSDTGENFLQNMQARIQSENHLSLQLRKEKRVPVGYSMTIDSLTPDNILDNIDTLTQLMSSHHAAYAQAAQALQEKFDTKGTIPQPSYRLYAFFSESGDGEPKKLTLRIAPEIFSHSGVMEAAGVEMLRDPHYENPLSQRQTDRHRRRWIRKVEELTERDTTGEAQRTLYREKLQLVREEGKKLPRLRRINANFPEPELL